ncbi:TolC family protein [Trichocoleus sp. FACHB-90]|uniref:TolC family protein n=1 Tax=Cyanophyceae TaxID=3028117 RepID=UPI001684DF68|nr:TolC family protein [Trichocoleus sp. FACHB-90]MBD1927159.1 TolC family protein [Trichocoleus sp. FACHB-90]
MYKRDRQISQHPDSLDNFLPPVSSWLGSACLLLVTIFGTAMTLAAAFKPDGTTVQPTAKVKAASSVAIASRRAPLWIGAKTHNSVNPQSPQQRGKPDAIALRMSQTLFPIPPDPQLQTKNSLTPLDIQLQHPSSPLPALSRQFVDFPSATNINPQSSDLLASKTTKLANLFAQTTQKPNQPEPITPQPGIQLNLADVVILAVQNNTDIKNAYLERIAQRQNLAVAEDKFIPNLRPNVSFNIERFGSGANTSTSADLGLGAIVSVNIPTGARLSFGWDTHTQTSNGNNFIDNINNDILGQNLQLRFTQPLLRGAGTAVNRASIEIARLDERANIQALKSTLINTITSAILGYRDLLQAQEQLEIERLSLESARQILQINQALIDAGRIAPVEIVQSQTEVANRELSLLAAQNTLASTKLALLDILDIGQNLDIVAVERIVLSSVSPELNKLKTVAFQNRPDYLQAQLRLEIAKLDQLVADNNRRLNLDFDARYNNSVSSTSQLAAGLVFSHTFGDRTAERDFQRSRVNFLQANNSLENLRQSIEIQVTDRVRDVNLRLSEVRLAQQARELSERQLQIEQERLKLGRGEIFQVVTFQNNLVEARNRELTAIIAYLNALTGLDQTVGTTLDTWNVTIETNR